MLVLSIYYELVSAYYLVSGLLWLVVSSYSTTTLLSTLAVGRNGESMSQVVSQVGVKTLEEYVREFLGGLGVKYELAYVGDGYYRLYMACQVREVSSWLEDSAVFTRAVLVDGNELIIAFSHDGASMAIEGSGLRRVFDDKHFEAIPIQITYTNNELRISMDIRAV